MKNSFYTFCIISTLIMLLALFTSLGFANANQAKVTDTNNKEYTVTNLSLEYRALGSWIGPPPTKTHKSIDFTVMTTEDRVTTEESLLVNFKDTKRIEFTHQANATWSGYTVTIQLKNGQEFFYDRNKKSLIKRDDKGNITENYDGVYLAAGKYQDQDLKLMEFKGRAKNSKGMEGEFSIFYNEVSAIDFL